MWHRIPAGNTKQKSIGAFSGRYPTNEENAATPWKLAAVKLKVVQ